jgi:hypothetical protein
MADELDLWGEGTKLKEAFVIRGVKTRIGRKPKTHRTNSQLTKTTRNLSQMLKFTLPSETLNERISDETSPDDVSLSAEDHTSDDLEGHRNSYPSRETISDRSKKAEWFTSPIHRTESVNPQDNAIIDELRNGTEQRSLEYTLGSYKYPPSPRFRVDSPDNIKHLGRPNRRVFWEDVKEGQKRVTSGLACIKSSGSFHTSWPIKQAPKLHTATNLPTKSQVKSISTDKKSLIVTKSLPNFEESPYANWITHLRREGLKLEEDILLELKRQQELERMRGPMPRWYELRTREFHHEAKRNTDMLHRSVEWQDMLEYTKKLMRPHSTQ